MTDIDDRSKSTDPRCPNALRPVRPSWPSLKESSRRKIFNDATPDPTPRSGRCLAYSKGDRGCW